MQTSALPKVIAVVGPTASGKTALGITLAKKFSGEIISADSRQIYRGMNLIAGVVSRSEMQGVPHHMLRIANPKRQYSAGEFTKKAENEMDRIYRRNHLPIVVGGTGFYIDVLLSEIILPDVPPNKALRKKLEAKTAAQLFKQLQKLDPARTQTIDPFNKVRLIRSIEIATALGNVPTLSREPKYDVLWLGLPEPARHVAKLQARVETRLRKGMVAEAKKLRAVLSKKRFAELGMEFELLGEYLDKKISRQALIDGLARWERNYAKRQMRWLKRNKNIYWITTLREARALTSSFLQSA